MRRGNRRFDAGDSGTRHKEYYDRHSDMNQRYRGQESVHGRNLPADDNRFRGDSWRNEQTLESDGRYWEASRYDDRRDGVESGCGGHAADFGQDNGRDSDYHAREIHGRRGDELYFPGAVDHRQHDYSRGVVEDYSRATDFDDQHRGTLYDERLESGLPVSQGRDEDAFYERERAHYDDRSRDNMSYDRRERDSQSYSYRDAGRAVLLEDIHDSEGQGHKVFEGDGRYDRRGDKDRTYEGKGSRQHGDRKQHTDRRSGYQRGRENETHRDMSRESPSGRETVDVNQKTRYQSSQSEKSYRKDSSNQSGSRFSKDQQDRKKCERGSRNRDRENQPRQETIKSSRDQGHDHKRPSDSQGSGNREEKMYHDGAKKNSRERSDSRQRSNSFRNHSAGHRDSSISRNSHSEKEGIGQHRSQDVKKTHRLSSHQSGHSDKNYDVSDKGNAYAEEDVLNILADDDRFNMEANMYSSMENVQADQEHHRHSRDNERMDRHNMIKSETDLDAPFEIHADCSASIFEEKFKSPARTFDKSQNRLSRERHDVSNEMEDSSRHVKENRRNMPYNVRPNRSKQSGRFSSGFNKKKNWLQKKKNVGLACQQKIRNFGHDNEQLRNENIYDENDRSRSIQNRIEQGGNRSRMWNRGRFRNRGVESNQAEKSENRQGVEQDRFAGQQRNIDSSAYQKGEPENRYSEYGESVSYDRNHGQRSGNREQAYNYSGNSHRAWQERKSRIRGYTHYDRVKRKYFGRNTRGGGSWNKRNARNKQSAQRNRQVERGVDGDKKDITDEVNREGTGINVQPVDQNQQIIFIPNAGFQGGQAPMVDQFGTILMNSEMGIHPGEPLQQVTVPLANQGLEAPPGSEYIFIPFVNQVPGMPDSMASSGMDRRVVHGESEGAHQSKEQAPDNSRNQDRVVNFERKKRPLTKQQLAQIKRKLIMKRRQRLEKQLEQKILKKLLGKSELSETLRKTVTEENKPRLQLKRISPPSNSRGTGKRLKMSRPSGKRTALEEVSDEDKEDQYDKVSDLEDVTDDEDYNRAEGGNDRRQTFRKPGEPRRSFRRRDQDLVTSGGDVRKVVELDGRGRTINDTDRHPYIPNRQSSINNEIVKQQNHSPYDDGLSNRRERAYEKGSMSPIQITVSNDRFSKEGTKMSNSRDNESDGRKSSRYTRTINERFTDREHKLSSRSRDTAFESVQSDSYNKGCRDEKRNYSSNKQASSPSRNNRSRGRYCPKQGSTSSDLRKNREEGEESKKNDSRDRERDVNRYRGDSYTRDDEMRSSERRERPGENMSPDRNYQGINRQINRNHTEAQSQAAFQHNVSYPSQQSVAQVQPQFSTVTSQSFPVPQPTGVQLLNPNINIDQSLPPVINMSQVSSQGVMPDMSLPPPTRMPSLGDQNTVLIQQHALPTLQQQQQQQLLQQSLQQQPAQHFQPQVQHNQQFQQVTQQLQIPQQLPHNVQQYQGSLGGIQQTYIPSGIQQAVQSVQQSVGQTNPGTQIYPVQTSQQLPSQANQLQQTLPMAGVQPHQGQFQIGQVAPSSTSQVLPSSQLNLAPRQITSSQQSYVATTQHQAMSSAVGNLQQGSKSQQPVIGTIQAQMSHRQQGIIKVPKGSLHFAQTNVKSQGSQSVQSYGAGTSDKRSPSRYSRGRGSDFSNYKKSMRSQEINEPVVGEDEEDDAGELLCTKCEKVYLSDQVMRKHARWHDMVENGKSDLRCDNCEQAFHSSSSLHSHIAKLHTFDSWNCTVCDITFHNSTSLVHHMRVKKHVSVMNKFSCSLCVASFKYVRQLVTHRDSVHSDKQGFRSHSFRRY